METKREIIVILDNVRSIHNVGSIFRTGNGAGVKKIYLCGVTPSPFDRFDKILPQFSKVSLGAEKYLEWEKVKSTAKIIQKLKSDGYKIIAIEQNKKSIPYFKLKIKNLKSKIKIALILGNEPKGISLKILKIADAILEIPMYGQKESLNVSVAFGVVVYRLAVTFYNK